MIFEEITERNNQYMRNDSVDEGYQWNDKNLEENLQGCLIKERERFPYRYGEKLTEEQIFQNNKVKEINKLINEYNCKFENNEVIREKLEKLYEEINCEHWILNKNIIFEQLNFEKRILLTGPGGIGKSQYIYEWYNKINGINYKKCFIYGKYSDDITEELLEGLVNEIIEVSENEKILFVIDAINEFSSAKKNILYRFIEKVYSNIRIIISCRDFSLDDEEMNMLCKNIDEQIPFSGVDVVDGIRKISEKCNIDLTKYEEIMYDNNPLHLNIIKNIISNNRLERIDNNSINMGTDIYEQYIKNTTKKYNINKNKYWNELKSLIKYFFENDISFPKIENVIHVLGDETEDFFRVMKKEGFIEVKDDFLIFKNETLEAYLIAREMFEKIPRKEKDIIEFLNNKIKVFSFIHEQLIIMLFDKYSNLKKVSRIIKKTKLNNYFGSIRLLNRIKFSKDKRKKFIKVFRYNGSVENILFSAGGFENNPLNCTNYLNKIILNGNTNLHFQLTEIDKRYVKSHLTTWIRTIATFECNKEYLEEKFWFSIWCMSLSNKNIRYLARKLIYEIVQKDCLFIDKMIKIYFLIEDEFIKEGIIQILCSQKRNNLKIKRFINRINSNKLINFRILYYISKYLFREEKYTCFNKENVFIDNKDKYINKDIYNFIKRISYVHKYEYTILGMDRYGEKIRYYDKFIKEDKKKINEVNKYINKYWKCKEYCKCVETFKKEIILPKYGMINENTLNDKKIYMAWQQIFKQELKKYKIKYKDLESFVAYEDENKNLAYKALEIANAKLIGSLASNYFTNEFIIDENRNNGYLEYKFEKYTENIELNFPVTIFNEDIEALNKKIMRNIEIPNTMERFDNEWADNRELSLKNFKNIIKPVKCNGKNWIMIYGSVRLKLEDIDLGWSDEYIVNLSINENYTLKKNPSIDRLYTIETRNYNGNINDYYKCDYTQSTSIDKDSFWDDFFVKSDYNLPPTAIINEFKLIYDNKMSAWIDENNNKIILVSNNKDSWYKQGVTGSIFIEENYYKILKEKYNLKFFGFTERFLDCYRDESSLQIEYIDDNRVITYLHYVEGITEEENTCQNCKVYKKDEANYIKKRGRRSKIEELILKYAGKSEEIVN